MRIPIVNEQDEIIGYRDRKDRSSKGIFRITGLWVTAPNGDVLLAQRALNKERGAGLWGPAVAGTVEEGETYESNIIKEAQEEIGLSGLKFVLGPKVRSLNQKHFTQWFTAVVDKDYSFKKQDEEVEALKWASRKEIAKLLKEKPETFLTYFKQYFDFF